MGRETGTQRRWAAYLRSHSKLGLGKVQKPPVLLSNFPTFKRLLDSEELSRGGQ